MANPPITIGPFTNVPAPGSPIKSDWPQQISQYTADLVKWVGANVAGPEVQVFPGGTVVTIGNATIPSAGNYVAWGTAAVVNRGTGVAQVQLNLRINGVTVGPPGHAWLVNPLELQTIPLFGLTALPAGARPMEFIGVAPTGTVMVAARAIQMLRVP